MSTEKIRSNVRSFVATMLLDGGVNPVPITVEDCAYTMNEWDAEGIEYPEGMTAEMLMTAWNELVQNVASNATVYRVECVTSAGLAPFHTFTALSADELILHMQQTFNRTTWTGRFLMIINGNEPVMYDPWFGCFYSYVSLRGWVQFNNFKYYLTHEC